MAIVVLAFLGKSLKYETWHWLHRLVYLAYIFGLSHVYLIIVFLFHFQSLGLSIL
ncbi:oxidoreductase [Streptococcus thermophilus]|nr:oxidoreductase [Streptococcus thermophilus]AOZ59571.1 oxidoreductase [Streptococcus thermophilus]KPL38223.1 hypothetical protein ADU38_16 [Streptococcus thermophilus]